MATIVVAGIIVTEMTQNFINNNAREAFIARTKIAAAGITPTLIETLTGKESDTASHAYRQLKKQLIAIKGASNDMRFVYLMGRRNKQVVFLVDAEPADSKDYSPPGQVYTNPSDHLLKIFQNGAAFVEGPVTDKWGIWISGHAPIIEPDSGHIIE